MPIFRNVYLDTAARRETRRFARRLLAAMAVIVAVLAAAGIGLARRELRETQAAEAARAHAAG
ncbi:MAG: hypothetical protein H7067_14685, partial [Burkholderiales bacterium]|nr:hypothetical protein [Opitutaceae bacterium]